MMQNDWHDSSQSRKNPSRFLARLLLPAALMLAAFMPAHADEPAPNEHTARHEVDFLQNTIDHHLQSIRMSELCTQLAATPELTELCTTMATAHQEESDQLQAWLDAWYGETHEPHLADTQRDLLAQLEMQSGGEFERSFLKQMIPHHMTGIAESAKCAAQFHHEELLDMCTASIAAQAEEIRTMRTMLCEEYGICSLELRQNPVADEPNGETDGDEMPADDGTDNGEGDDGGNGVEGG
jgi:uncharacterized protein (DUF305 family)